MLLLPLLPYFWKSSVAAALLRQSPCHLLVPLCGLARRNRQVAVSVVSCHSEVWIPISPNEAQTLNPTPRKPQAYNLMGRTLNLRSLAA